LRTENVYSINAAGCQTLNHQRDDAAYWDQLISLDLAEWGNAEQDSAGLASLPSIPSRLEFIWFEITPLCNQRCLHCYAESGSASQHECAAAVRSAASAESDRLTYQDWLRLIAEGYSLGCREGQFIGGEPAMYHGENQETVIDLAKHAKRTGYEFVEIFTNATLLTEKDLREIKDLGVHIAVSIYSHSESIHDFVTQTAGSHYRVTQTLERLQELNIPTRIATILMRANQDTIEKTCEWISCLGFRRPKVDTVRPTGRGSDIEIAPTDEIYRQYAVATRPDFKARRRTVCRSLHENSCLSGKITIVDSGVVLPCIFGRTWEVGNVHQSSLTSIISGDPLQRLWHFTKDQVLVCRDCEYRYVCGDCRPLAHTVSKHLEAPSPRCAYNPYTGEWGEGVWRLDQSGKPVYVYESSPEKSRNYETQRAM